MNGLTASASFISLMIEVWQSSCSSGREVPSLPAPASHPQATMTSLPTLTSASGTLSHLCLPCLLFAEFGCLIPFPFYTVLIAYFGSEPVTPRASKGDKIGKSSFCHCRNCMLQVSRSCQRSRPPSWKYKWQWKASANKCSTRWKRRIGRSMQEDIKSATSIQLREKRLSS